jgi:hypothetical protein
MAMERDGWGLGAMAAMTMGRVGDGASARWGARAIDGDGWGVGGLVGSVIGSIVGSMAGNLMLEDDSKWLEGLILGAAGWLDGVESRAQARRWGRQG